MKEKLLLLIIVFSLIVALPLAADWQTDIGINIPYYIGVGNIGEEDESGGEAINYAFLVPDVRVQYYFGTETLRVGPGFRGFTAIIETLAYPIVSVESVLGRFVFNAHVGGGAFLLFGLFNDFAFGSLILPEISAAYRLGERFSIGTGALFITNPGSSFDMDAFAYVGTVFARFTF
jgi:hypothetical protein